jgi:hypothetical protein
MDKIAIVSEKFDSGMASETCTILLSSRPQMVPHGFLGGVIMKQGRKFPIVTTEK